MNVMRVTERHNNVLFTVALGDRQFRAVQLVDRYEDGKIYANTVVAVGDNVLVVEVPGFLLSPSMDDPTDSVSHLIVGLVPLGSWQGSPNYGGLVESS